MRANWSRLERPLGYLERLFAFFLRLRFVFVLSAHATPALFFVCGAAFARGGIGSSSNNKEVHVDEGVGMMSLPAQHAAATSSLGGGSNPNPTCAGAGGGGGGADGGESGSARAAVAGSAAAADGAAS